MGMRRRLFLHLTAAVFLLAATAYTQDSPSLGDLARQQRQQKEKSKTSQGKDNKSSKVITNEEIHAHAGTETAPAAAGEEHSTSTTPSNASSSEVKQPAEVWTSQISAQKSQIAFLQKQLDAINQSIQFAPGNCVENCVQWNERQVEKQRQAEGMQAQLDELKKHLEQMQDSARKQGYGSAVYDP
jgi:hypothetical protein